MSPQCHKYLLQHSKFAFERTQVRPWGRRFNHGGAKLVFLLRVSSNLVTPLHVTKFETKLNFSQSIGFCYLNTDGFKERL